MSSTTATTTITNTPMLLRQILRGADPGMWEVNSDEKEVEGAEHDNNDTDFLPLNHGVTGREPNTNPSNWPEDHRRMPPHRPPVPHPEWVTVGGPLPMRIFLSNMFSGCQVLQWGYSVARATGLHDRGYCMYQVANEW